MNAIVGNWKLSMRTPIGTIDTEYRFIDDGGAIAGSASGAGETTPLTDINVVDAPDGQRVTWKQRITKPLRLNLEFETLVVGDSMTGESRAGRLPRTRVTGTRAPQ